MSSDLKDGLAKGYILGCFIGLIICVAILAYNVGKLQGQVELLQLRNEIITQQLQELYNYVEISGG
ncbi:TPA: hypothetical protein U1C31_001140 [Streptococcus suis]|nr:hypothetical protein [Streptococcus suis]